MASNPLFDAYLARYPDVAADRNFSRDPMSHFQRFGEDEGRTWGEVVAAPAANPPMITDPGPMVDPAKVGYMPGFGNTDADWNAFRDGGQQHTAGLNRIPNVYSDFAGMSTDPTRAQGQMFHQTPEAVQGAVSPLFSALLGAITGTGGGNANAAAGANGGADAAAMADAEYRMMHPGDPRSQAEAARRLEEHRISLGQRG